MEKFEVLLIDDDRKYCENFKLFTRDHFDLRYALNAKSALKLLKTSFPDIIFLDYWLGNRENGLDVLKQIRKWDAQIPVIMISEQTSIEVAVESMKLGAYHYTSKYGSVKELLVLVKQELGRLRERLLWQRKLDEKYDPLLGDSPALQKVKHKIKQYTQVESTVLITGESGVGKELAAWEIHKSSQRQKQPFIAVNCSAIPENLFESELFGHERGAFTGANQRRIGHFELANGGTLFLDEIGTLSSILQAKLLRALESQSIQRVGAERVIPIDIRIIAATNLDLTEALQSKSFRVDLYHRLNVLNLYIPPLRERIEDIPIIADFFLQKYSIQTQKPTTKLQSEHFQMLQNYPWPGNVRELKNTIERFVVLGDSALREHFRDTSADQPTGPVPMAASLLDLPYQEAKNKLLNEFQQFYFHNVIKRYNGNIKKAAEWMGVQRTTIYRGLGSTSDEEKKQSI
ncbi:MAG: sigma-54-dependent transcriptional regulator [bacterium]